MSDAGMNESHARDPEVQVERRSQELAIRDGRQDRERLSAQVDQRQARGGVEHDHAQARIEDGPAGGSGSPRR